MKISLAISTMTLMLGAVSVFAVEATGWAPAQIEETKLLASDGAAGDWFGREIAVDGDTVIVSASRDDDSGSASGSAYIFVHSGGVWTEQEKLVASDGAAQDEFGASVAIDGDTVIVGAEYDSHSGDYDGSAYVFVRSGGIWSEQGKLLAADGASRDAFGAAVAIEGDTAIVGAPKVDDSGEDSGAAYVFVRSGGIWTQQDKLLASDGEAGDRFGYAVSIDGETALIGTENDAGAYVFVRDGAVWSEEAKLLASDGEAGDFLGWKVGIAGDIALVSAPNDSDTSLENGSAYVFARRGGVWSEEAKLLASDGVAEDYFGVSVSVAGAMAIIGTAYDDDSGVDSGSAYVFVRRGGIWSEEAKFLASDGATNDQLGSSVACGGAACVVGAHRRDDQGADSGSAYVFPAPLVFADGFETGATSTWSDSIETAPIR